MIKNRSVPADTVLPHITYTNLPLAIEWMAAIFGFVEHYRYGNPVQGAQMHLGKAFVMANSARPGQSSPAALGSATQSVTVFVEDVEAHYAHSVAAARRSSRISTRPRTANCNMALRISRGTTGSLRATHAM